MVPRGVVALGGVHRIGVRGDDRADLADPVTVFRAGAGHVHTAHLQRPQMVLVRSDEHLHAASVALGSTRMADAHGVCHTRLRVDGLADGTAAMHVRAHIAVLLLVKFEQGGLIVAAGQLLPAERRLAQPGDLMSRLSGVDVVVKRPRFAFGGTHVHPVQSAVIELRIVRHVEARIHGQRLGRIVVRDCLHTACGLGFGGLDGVLPAVFVRRNLAGGVGRVLVVGERVGELELHVVNQVAGNTIDGTQRLERESADRLAGGDFHRTLERVPRAQPAVRVGSVHRGGLLAHLVAPVGSDAGHLDRLLMTGRSDEDLDLLVGVDGAVTMRVTEFHGVHGRRVVRGVDVLVQVRVGLRCGDLGVHVVVRLGALDLDDAAAPVDPGVGLVGLPAELGGVEPVEVDPVLGRLALAVEGAADLHVAVRRVDVGEVVLVGHLGLADDVPPIMVEVAVDELLRQAVGGVFHHIVVRRESHSAGGLVLGGLGGVLPAALVRRDLAGRIGRVLVIGELVCLGENHVVQQISGVEGRRVNALEREHRHIGSGYIDSLISRPLSVMVP